MDNKCQGITLKGNKCRRKSVGHTHCHLHRNTHGYREVKPEDCLICCESLNNQRHALDCGHWIHTQCIVNSAKAECPLCRKPVDLGIRDMTKLTKLAKKRKLDTLQEEEEELRAGLQDHVTELIGPLLQERLQDAVGFLLENAEDLDETTILNDEMYQGFLDTLLNYENEYDDEYESMD